MSSDPKYAALNDCLEQIQRGASLEQALAHYPQWAAELRPLLVAAQAAGSLRPLQVPMDAKMRSRARFLAAAQERRPANPVMAFFAFLRFKAVAVTLSLVLVAAIVGTGIASAQSLPGDGLYAIKLASERTRLLFTTDPAQRLEMEEDFDQERAKEVEALFGRQQKVEVTFAGFLASDSSGQWSVGGVALSLPPEIDPAREYQPGAYVEVHGVSLSDGKVQVEWMQLREVQFNGVLQSIQPGQWVVSGITVTLTPDTVISGGSPSIGGQVSVDAIRMGATLLHARTLTLLGNTGEDHPPLQASPTPHPEGENFPQWLPRNSPPSHTRLSRPRRRITRMAEAANRFPPPRRRAAIIAAMAKAVTPRPPRRKAAAETAATTTCPPQRKADKQGRPSPDRPAATTTEKNHEDSGPRKRNPRRFRGRVQAAPESGGRAHLGAVPIRHGARALLPRGPDYCRAGAGVRRRGGSAGRAEHAAFGAGRADHLRSDPPDGLPRLRPFVRKITLPPRRFPL